MFLRSSWAWYACSSKLYLFASVIVNEPELTLCKSVQAFYETPLLGVRALAGSERWLLSCLQELHCGLLSAAQPYTQEWSHCGSSGSSTESASSVLTVGKHCTVSAAFTAAELNCDSNEECTQQRRGVGLGQCAGDSLHEDLLNLLSHTEAEHGCSTIVLIIAPFPRTQATMCWTLFLLQLLQQLDTQYLLKGWGYVHLQALSWFFKAGINCLHWSKGEEIGT